MAVTLLVSPMLGRHGVENGRRKCDQEMKRTDNEMGILQQLYGPPDEHIIDAQKAASFYLLDRASAPWSHPLRVPIPHHPHPAGARSGAHISLSQPGGVGLETGSFE